ncbi:hypothetical protein ES703_35096 [subsurface metagenome]
MDQTDIAWTGDLLLKPPWYDSRVILTRNNRSFGRQQKNTMPATYYSPPWYTSRDLVIRNAAATYYSGPWSQA